MQFKKMVQFIKNRKRLSWNRENICPKETIFVCCHVRFYVGSVIFPFIVDVVLGVKFLKQLLIRLSLSQS